MLNFYTQNFELRDPLHTLHLLNHLQEIMTFHKAVKENFFKLYTCILLE